MTVTVKVLPEVLLLQTKGESSALSKHGNSKSPIIKQPEQITPAVPPENRKTFLFICLNSFIFQTAVRAGSFISGSAYPAADIFQFPFALFFSYLLYSLLTEKSNSFFKYFSKFRFPEASHKCKMKKSSPLRIP